MPRYAYQTPRARVYAYNYGYMNNYYKPLTYYVEKEARAPSEQPGHQSLAERLKTFPMDGSIYRSRASSVPPLAITAGEEKEKAVVVSPAPLPDTLDLLPPRKSPYALTLKEELRRLPPVWHRHPWDWDCLWIPPHETRVTPHFGVGSSHDLILRYYSLRPWRHWFLDDYRPTYTRHYLLRDFDQGVGLSLGHRLCPFHDAEIPRSVTALEGKKDLLALEGKKDLLALERKKEFRSMEKSVEIESTKEAVEKKESLKAIAY